MALDASSVSARSASVVPVVIGVLADGFGMVDEPASEDVRARRAEEVRKGCVMASGSLIGRTPSSTASSAANNAALF